VKVLLDTCVWGGAVAVLRSAGHDAEELTEIDGERFVVLPAGTLDSRRWTVGGWPALKLSSE